MSEQSSILLRGGIVLEHGTEDTVIPRCADVLVLGNRISEVAPNLQAPGAETQVIDCQDKIISPGFIDTHRHMWQTQLKGRHANHNLGQYIPAGNMTGIFYTNRDVYLGTLGAGAECVDAGTTTVVDFAHVAHSISHVRHSIEALVASGLRAIFCLVPTAQVESWEPTLKMRTAIPYWFLPEMKALAAEMPLADGRVQLGLGFDSFYLPKDDVLYIYQHAKDLKITLFTSHHFRGAVDFDAITPLAEYDLLGPETLLSHATNMTESDMALLIAAGAHISTSPSTELQMGLGEPVCFMPKLSKLSSLGVDCHSATSSSLVSEARLMLQHFRAVWNSSSPFQDEKGFAIIKHSVVDAFNLITVKGARAIRLEDQIGQIKAGMLADLIIWDATSPAMLAAAQHDPVAAIIMHSSPRDIDTVIVNGVLRKQGGHLLPFDLSGGKTEWKAIASDVLASRERLQRTIDATVPDLIYR